MDINSIANNSMQTYLTDTYKQAAEVGKFQSVLENAMNGSGEGQVNNEDVLEACQSFESYFLQTIFREMRKTSLDGGGFIGKSNAENIFTDMLDEEIAKQASEGSGIGLADMMYKQLSKEYIKA